MYWVKMTRLEILVRDITTFLSIRISPVTACWVHVQEFDTVPNVIIFSMSSSSNNRRMHWTALSCLTNSDTLHIIPRHLLEGMR